MKAAAFNSVPILAGDEWDSSVAVEGHNPAEGEDMQAFMNGLSPGYFATMQIPILEGRDFSARRWQARDDVGDRQSEVRGAFLQGPERDRQAHRVGQWDAKRN